MTHLPNELALKMDGAVACHRHRADKQRASLSCRRAWGLLGSERREAT